MAIITILDKAPEIVKGDLLKDPVSGDKIMICREVGTYCCVNLTKGQIGPELDEILNVTEGLIPYPRGTKIVLEQE